MAGEDRAAPPAVALAAALSAQPWTFDFFQAVRRLECAHRALPRIGTSARPAADPVRLAQEPSLSFAPSTVAAFSNRRTGEAPRLASYFFGLFGPNGPLPQHLTEYAYERLNHRRDPTFARFADLFHHRMLCLFYRAWALAQPTVSFDRPDDDWFGRYLAALFGCGSPALRQRDAMPDRARLYYAGLLSGQSRHPAGLRAMLADFFRLPVRIGEFIGTWVRLPVADRCRPGETPQTATLGRTAILGVCVWGAQHRFRLVLGPVSEADFRRFLPGGASLPRLVAMVRTYTGDDLDWDLNLVIKRQETPALRLDGLAQLGWTTWLPAAERRRDPDDLIIAPLASAKP